MTEFYLHYLWITKQITLLDTVLVDGTEFEILDFGCYNAHMSGPDFSAVKIRMNGMIWYGCVEMHVKSSDWFGHNHHNDNAYNTVILHVVYDNNRPVQLNGINIPTVELKAKLNTQHLSWYQRATMPKKGFSCSNLVTSIAANVLRPDWERSAYNRQVAKLNRYTSENSHLDHSTLLYRLIGRSFGGTVNQLPFDQLTAILPLKEALQLDPIERYYTICAMSGLPELQSSKGIQSQSMLFMKNSSWKRKGQRFYSHPVVRVQQFAKCIAMWESINTLDWSDLQNVLFQWRTFFQQINDEPGYPANSISLMLQNHILINAISPYLLFSNPSTPRESLHKWLGQIPPEKNERVTQWKAISQFPENALHTQGCLQYYDDFCKKHACLSCTIGKMILCQ
jgi:hypothetical protein